MVLEKHPVAEQYAALSQAAMMFQLHGSSMAWALLLPKGRIFAEMLGISGNVLSTLATEPYQVGVNTGFGTYGKLQRSFAFHHFTHLVSNLSFVPVTPQCRHDGRSPPPLWKACSLRVPPAPFRLMVGKLADDVFADPEGHLGRYFSADIPGVSRGTRLVHALSVPRDRRQRR
eukprot:TRINITY_DN75608_c0_g1_i1.p1 TRINITY_DN75608_c0_g1~~TRINITY_DN75608_c0_g1_i1.p1  ORF type:complete len:202 (+),score=49.74 TRINITY_DN75608_c0_g1_i1:88-606(+)